MVKASKQRVAKNKNGFGSSVGVTVRQNKQSTPDNFHHDALSSFFRTAGETIATVRNGTSQPQLGTWSVEE